MNNSDFSIDLSNLDLADVEVLNQESKGMPEFAASSCETCGGGTCSCTIQKIE